MLTEPHIQVAGYPVVCTTAATLTDFLSKQVVEHKKTALLFANTNFVVRCRHLLSRMKRGDITIVNDGVGLDIAVNFIYRRRFMENLAGSDFIPYFFSRQTRPLKIFLIGGKPEAVVGAAHYAREVLHQQVVGTCDGYGEMRDTINLVEVINRSGAELVMVALGNPIQEEWILSNLGTLEANVIMGVGALFDFWSGDKPRAPGFMRRLRLEWLFRLCIEPRRLMARYTVDFLHFLFLCRKFR